MDRLGDTIKGYIQRHKTIFGSVSSVLNATILFVPSSSRYYEVIAEGMHACAYNIICSLNNFSSNFKCITSTHSISISISSLYLSPPLPCFLHLYLYTDRSIDRCSPCLHTLTHILTYSHSYLLTFSTLLSHSHSHCHYLTL